MYIYILIDLFTPWRFCLGCPCLISLSVMKNSHSWICSGSRASSKGQHRDTKPTAPWCQTWNDFLGSSLGWKTSHLQLSSLTKVACLGLGRKIGSLGRLSRMHCIAESRSTGASSASQVIAANSVVEIGSSEVLVVWYGWSSGIPSFVAGIDVPDCILNDWREYTN
jgi:hypothetical protein